MIERRRYKFLKIHRSLLLIHLRLEVNVPESEGGNHGYSGQREDRLGKRETPSGEFRSAAGYGLEHWFPSQIVFHRATDTISQ